MLSITKNIQLKEIQDSDAASLFLLMKEVYPLAYNHFWEDGGEWYVNTQYSQENIKKELSEKNVDYYFVLFKDEIIGNLRIVWNCNLKGFKDEKQVKLHRIYLHQKVQGVGIGKTLLTWVEERVKKMKYTLIWLDAMDTQPSAFAFYKKQKYVYHSHYFLPFELLHNHVRKISQLYKRIKD